MDVLGIIRSQYQAALDMLAAAVEACPDAVWDRPEDRNRSWQVAYHALFYLHFYLQPTEADFRPWPKHREQAPHFDRPPWLPEGEFVASEAYPLIKTGGLADVAGSLPEVLRQARACGFPTMVVDGGRSLDVTTAYIASIFGLAPRGFCQS